MASQQQKAPGGHYSGHNPIPTVKQFVENLDKDKKERDRQIDAQAAAARQGKTGQNATTASDAQPHKMQKRSVEGTEKTVTDPTTGNQVTISDVNKSMMAEVEDPHIVVPNANLQKDTVRQTCDSIWSHRLMNPSLSRQTPTSRSRTTSTTRTSRRRPIQLPKEPHPTCPSMAKRLTFFSIQRRRSATNQLSLLWRSEQVFSASEY